MKKCVITLRGTSSILMNPMKSFLTDQLEKQSEEHEAEQKVIRNENDEIGLPSEYLMHCLMGAGRMVRYRKEKRFSTVSSSIIPSVLKIQNRFLVFKNQKEKMFINKRSGCLTNFGAKAVFKIIRPEFKNWEFDVEIVFDDRKIKQERLKELFEKAGNIIGMGDSRPQKRGSFGRFKIVSLK